MQKNLALCVILTLSSGFVEFAHADPNVTQLTCYSVKHNKLSQPYSCTDASEFGAGGNWDTIKFAGKSYTYVEETDPSAENPAEAKVIDQELNKLPAHAYIRSLKNPSQILVMNASSHTTATGLFCMKNAKVDICEKFNGE